MKIMKKVLIGFGIVLILFVAAAILIPILFKDDIKAAIDKEIAKSVNADVIFEADNFDLTLFKNFPNATAVISELGVFNREPFEGVPLFVVEKLEVEVNLKEMLFGDELRLKGITLVRPQINIKVLADGRANWDITYPSTDTVTVEEEEGGEFSFGIDNWKIVDGDLSYDDQSIPYAMNMIGLNHTGNGDFNEKEFDLRTKTNADTLSVTYDGVEYITHKKLTADMVLAISEEYSKFTFKENVAYINDFGLAFDGWFKMNDDSYDMDINYQTEESTFKSLLSLVPGMYTQDFGNIETNGNIAFTGMVKGVFSEIQMPAFNLAVKVEDGMFKYPDLPTAIKNINLDLFVDNKDGIIDNTVVDLKKLHLELGNNPVDARMLIENLKNYKLDGNVKASLNLAELNKMFPMEGLEVKGAFSVDATAKGVYDSIRKIIPAIDIAMSLKDGYVKSSEFPLPIENMQFTSTVKNTSGKMAETTINVKDLSLLMDGEKFIANMIIQNLDDYNWDIKANGGIDLEKMTKIFPIEGMTLAGKVKADIETKGKMSDVDAGRYDRLPTSGTASLENFKFSSKDLPYAVTVSKAQAVFDPSKIELKNTAGTIGKSDFALEGSVSNYIAYVFSEKETIKGNMTFRSNLLDLNEFMEETEETPATTEEEPYGVIPVPENIDFTLHSSINTVKMMDYTITNASGDIIVKNGIANLNGLKFSMLGGKFQMTGTYNTRDIAHPKYDMDLKIEGLAIQQAASSFSVVKTYAPIAGLVNGDFSTDFKISGELLPTMMPNLATVNGAGLIKVAQAALTQSKLVSGITSLTKLEDSDNVTLRDVLMSASIDNGRLSVKPFDVQFGSYKTTVAGSTGLDGSIDYSLKMNVPAGKLGGQLQGFVNQYTGSSNSTSEIPVTIGVGGSYNDPKARLVMQEQKQQVKEAVTTVVQEKSKEVVSEALKGTDPKDIVNNLLKGNKPDSAQQTQAAKDTTKAAPVEQLLQNKLNSLLKKKKNN
ncbi:MAG TPA: AsmA-like C-terminal region-containing protein [Cyclobacteriaceae bacterium]|nr:AsmA-like C-terminal region-containing protein [Cyclobacteriaceae bacterium]